MLKQWDELPDFMKVQEVRPYWEILNKKRGQIILKRMFDFVMALIVLIILAVPMAIISILIKKDSNGPIFYRQERVTIYGKCFRIHKFRTMVHNADKIGTSVTIENDSRITKIGGKLRAYRLDELPQLFDIIKGDMSFVGSRPEVIKYVEKYKPEYNATFLMPAGITSEASIQYKDENKLLDTTIDVDTVYMNQILPLKMKLNLESIEHFCFSREILIMFRTILVMIKNLIKG